MTEWNLQVYSNNKQEIIYKYYSIITVSIHQKYIKIIQKQSTTITIKDSIKKNDYYYLSNEYFIINWDKIRPDYIIDSINYFKDKYVYINDNTNRHEDTFEDIRNILYINKPDYLIIDDRNIKSINLIDEHEKEIVEQHMISIIHEDLNYFSEELKNLIQMTGYQLKFGYIFIKIIPEVVKYIKIVIR